MAWPVVTPSALSSHCFASEVRRNGLALEFASEELQRDREVVMEAVDQNGAALCFLTSGRLQVDPDVGMAAVSSNGVALKCIPVFAWTEWLLRAAFRSHPGVYWHAQSRRPDLTARALEPLHF